MFAAVDVVPGAWKEIIVLYDDGNYSAIWGRFRGNIHRDLGVRWNGGEGEVGYPNSRRYPQWYVEPPFLHNGVLNGLKQQLLKQEESHTNTLYLRNIETALQETSLRR